ncbi:MAG: hypothetical protein LVR00_06515 [Rhabdochlamydiaceae bacterium]|jgi:hypothetical protein
METALLSPASLSPAFFTGGESSEQQAALPLVESPRLAEFPPEILAKIFEWVVYRSSSPAEENQNILALSKTCRRFNAQMESILSDLACLNRKILGMQETLGAQALVLTPALSLPPASGYRSKLSDIYHYEGLVFRLFRQLFPEEAISLSNKFLEKAVGAVEKELKRLIKPHLKMEMDVQAVLASAPFIPGRICRTIKDHMEALPLLQWATLGNPQHPEVVEFLMRDPISAQEIHRFIPNLLSKMAARNEVPAETDVQIVNSLYRHSVERLLKAHFCFSGMYEYGEPDERVVYIEQALLKLGGKFTAKNWESACEFSKPVKHNELFLAELFSILGERCAHFTHPRDIKCIDSGLKALIWARLSVKELDLTSKIKAFLPRERFNNILREIQNTYTERGFPYQWDRFIKPFESKERCKFPF